MWGDAKKTDVGIEAWVNVTPNCQSMWKTKTGSASYCHSKSQRRWAVAIYWRLEVLPRWDQIGSMTKWHAPDLFFLNWCNPIHSLACFARRAAVEGRVARRAKHARLRSSLHLESFMECRTFLDASWLVHGFIHWSTRWFILTRLLFHSLTHSLVHIGFFIFLPSSTKLISCVFFLPRITEVSASIPKGYSRPAAGVANF